jgi:hypothetical protein
VVSYYQRRKNTLVMKRQNPEAVFTGSNAVCVSPFRSSCHQVGEL